MKKKIVLGVFIGLIVGGILIQFLPYGHDHTNPPVTAEPQWNSQQTRDLVTRACYDCHSNQTTWPWYSNIAPISWLIQHDVEEGRSRLNFTEWNAASARNRRCRSTSAARCDAPVVLHVAASHGELDGRREGSLDSRTADFTQRRGTSTMTVGSVNQKQTGKVMLKMKSIMKTEIEQKNILLTRISVLGLMLVVGMLLAACQPAAQAADQSTGQATSASGTWRRERTATQFSNDSGA